MEPPDVDPKRFRLKLQTPVIQLSIPVSMDQPLPITRFSQGERVQPVLKCFRLRFRLPGGSQSRLGQGCHRTILGMAAN